MNEGLSYLLLKTVFVAGIFLCIFFTIFLLNKLYPKTLIEKNTKGKYHFNLTALVTLTCTLLGLLLTIHQIEIDITDGVMQTLFFIFFQFIACCILFISGIYVTESYSLYKFEFSEEINIKRNSSYALIHSSHIIGIGIIVGQIMSTAKGSATIALFLWCLVFVIHGLAFHILKHFLVMPVEKSVVQRQMSGSISYSSFYISFSYLLSIIFNRKIESIITFSTEIALNLAQVFILTPAFIAFTKALYAFHLKSKSYSLQGLSIEERDFYQCILESSIWIITGTILGLLIQEFSFSLS